MRKKPFRVSDLIMEITRRCNLECPHCCRGDAQPVEMEDDVMTEVFSMIEGCDTLTLTGGEPLMLLKRVRRLHEIAKKHEFTWGHFWVSTNGTFLTSEALLEVMSLMFDGYETFEDLRCSLQISTDVYHEAGAEGNRIPADLAREHGVPDIIADAMQGDEKAQQRVQHFFPWICFTHTLPESMLIAQGQAAKFYATEKRPEVMNDDDIYITAKGGISRSCDLSFEAADCCVLGSVFDWDVFNMVLEDMPINGGAGSVPACYDLEEHLHGFENPKEDEDA